MNTFEAFQRNKRAREEGAKSRTFDWMKAAEIIKQLNPKEATAGLEEDMEWTAGTIYQDGKIVTDQYTYLSSSWAKPVLVCDEVTYDCWKYQEDDEDFSDSKWPEEAVKHLTA